MTPYYHDDWLTIYQGDVCAVLPELPSDSVDCIVTSPPYWGLRDYGRASWSGGSEDCDHQAPDEAGATDKPTAGQRSHAGRFAEPVCHRCGAVRQDSQLGLERTPEEYVANMVAVFRELRRVLKPSGTCWLNLGDSYAANGQSGPHHGLAAAADRSQPGRNPRNPNRQERDDITRPDRNLGGLKPKDLVGIPWRVAFALQADGWYLRSDIIWAKPNPMPESVTDRPTKAHEMVFLLTKSPRYYFDSDAVRERVGESGVVEAPNRNGQSLVFGQDLGLESSGPTLASIGVRLAAAIFDRTQRQNDLSLFSLDSQVGKQGGDGHAGSPVVGVPVMRRAATQATRFANGDVTAKEFLSEMDRFCVALPDGDDFKETWGGLLASIASMPSVYADGDGPIRINHTSKVGQFEWVHDEQYTAATTTSRARVTGRGLGKEADKHLTGRQPQRSNSGGFPTSGRNLRSVWTIATRPYPGAHFAVFPPELPERCIKAGSSERGVCPECGAPWERVVERTPMQVRPGPGRDGLKAAAVDATSRTAITGTMVSPASSTTTGWVSTCKYDRCRSSLGEIAVPQRAVPDPIPAVVLDPFAGSGTTGMVANRLSRRAILIDLNGDYLKQQLARNAQTPLGLAG